MKTELLLVGGGLANALIARRILAEDPAFPLLVLERAPVLGADHTWSFHESDLTPAQHAWIEPLVAHAWPGQEVRFPRRRRRLETGYRSVSSARLHDVIAHALGERLLLGADAVEITATGATLADGTRIEARAVIDGRGDPGGGHLDVAFQKFLGLFVRVAQEHGLADPILMDATVDQRDGYRFVYTLPLSATELLIEDTYYSDGPELDRGALRQSILGYAARQGWEIAAVTGEEEGVLPILLGGEIEAFWREGPRGVARSGMRGAFFHPTTGYSLPEAVALAEDLATHRHLSGPELHARTRRRSLRHWRRGGYYRLLNRMLFGAARPDRRYRVFERFYGLDEGLIRRFYAGRLTLADKARLVTGKPPVPILRALRCLAGKRPPAASASHHPPRSMP
jgi:lycopene beta-cyclase